MSRAKSARFKSRKLSDQELLSLLDESLTSLSHLTTVYDQGHPPICLLMATEVQKILTENSAGVKLRGERTFTSPEGDDRPTMLNSMHKLTIVQVGGEQPKLDFIPSFFLPPSGRLLELPFTVWWNRDIIYRASAAKPGLPAGLVPLDLAERVPYEQREKINRRDFVSLLRNKLGSHQDSEMPHLLDELGEARSWGSFEIQTPDGLLSTEDGSLRAGTSIFAAMMRQIAHEVLVAFGRDDPPPSPNGAS